MNNPTPWLVVNGLFTPHLDGIPNIIPMPPVVCSVFASIQPHDFWVSIFKDTFNLLRADFDTSIMCHDMANTHIWKLSTSAYPWMEEHNYASPNSLLSCEKVCCVGNISTDMGDKLRITVDAPTSYGKQLIWQFTETVVQALMERFHYCTAHAASPLSLHESPILPGSYVAPNSIHMFAHLPPKHIFLGGDVAEGKALTAWQSYCEGKYTPPAMQKMKDIYDSVMAMMAAASPLSDILKHGSVLPDSVFIPKQDLDEVDPDYEGPWK